MNENSAQCHCITLNESNPPNSCLNWWWVDMVNHELSQDMWRVPPPVPWRVPRGLTWCPQVESRHVMRATARAMKRVTGPCIVPTSRAKTREPPVPWHVPWGLAWCPRVEPRHGTVPPPVPWHVPRGLAWCAQVESRHMTRATRPCLVPTSRAKTRHICHRLCYDVCHEALLDAHKPSQDTSRVSLPVPWRVSRGLAWFEHIRIKLWLKKYQSKILGLTWIESAINRWNIIYLFIINYIVHCFI